MTELKKVLNFHEEATHLRLRKACESWGAKVYPKVRVADVLPIEGSGLPDPEFQYALRSHFDFIVTAADSSPLFAVEFDGPIHRSARLARRDALKNLLCERFTLPLLRVNSRYLPKTYRQMDLLSWFVET